MYTTRHQFRTHYFDGRTLLKANLVGKMFEAACVPH